MDNAVTRTAAEPQPPVPVEPFVAEPSRTEHNVPHLAFVGMKTYRQCFGDRKGRSGHGEEHKHALVENASRTLKTEIEKAQAELIQSDIDTRVAPTIGQFADHDPAQGAAIDHSIATGEPLFKE